MISSVIIGLIAIILHTNDLRRSGFKRELNAIGQVAVLNTNPMLTIEFDA